MRAGLLLALLATVVGVGFAPAPRPRPPKGPDLTELQGMWRMVRYQHGGRDVLSGRVIHMRIEGKQLSFLVQERGGTGTSYEVEIDRKAMPPAMNWRRPGQKGEQYIGSYTMRHDTLSIVFAPPGTGKDRDRPTDFNKPRERDYLVVLKREVQP